MAIIPKSEKTATILVPHLPKQSGEGLRQDEIAQHSAIKSVENAEETLTKIRDAEESNAANTYAVEQATAIRDRAIADPDLKSENRYLTELDKIGTDAAQNITGEHARNDFIARFKISAAGTASAIRSSFREKQVQAAKATMLTSITALEEAYFGATFMQEKAAAKALLKQTVEDNINRGVLDRDSGTKLWLQISHDLPIKEAMRDIGINPVSALQRLQNNDYGIKDEDKRSDLIADAQRSIIREKKMTALGLEKAQEQKAVDLTSKLWDGSLTLTEIQTEMNAGELDRKDADYLRKGLLSTKQNEIQMLTGEKKKEAEVRQATTYMAMWDMILKRGKASDKRRELIKRFAEGDLKKEDAVKLYTGYIIPAQGGGKVSLAEEVAAEQSQKAGFIAGAIKAFRAFWNMPLLQDLGGEDE